MEELTSFSFRIPKTLAATIAITAKRMGLSRSEYARRAMQELHDRLMQERMGELSQRLADQSATVAHSMDASTSDGFE